MKRPKLTIETASKVLKTKHQIDSLTEGLKRYSHKNLDGKKFSVDLMSDSRHYEARNLYSNLPEEDRAAVDNYIIKKVRKAIRDGKRELAEMGIE